MILLLGILKRNNRYYMNVVNTDKPSSLDEYQLVNQFILNNCVNVKAANFLSSKQNPLDYLRGDFDVSRLVVDDTTLKKRIRDYQILTVYHNEKNEIVMYEAIDRAGNISIHDISEFEYTKYSSILGYDIDNLPNFVEHKKVDDVTNKLEETINNNGLDDIPVSLLKEYLILKKGFKEGYHTVTRVNNGIDFDIHEYLLFNGIGTIKLIEYVSKDKRIFMTKQDELSNPYPKERTASFLTSPVILLGGKRALAKFCKFGINTDFELFNSKAVKMSIPFCNDTLALYDKYIKSKEILYTWQTNFINNLSLDIYKNILPNEIYKLPALFYREMRSLPYSYRNSNNFLSDKDAINIWMYTVALFICWQFYTSEFKKSLMPLMKDYKNMYHIALNNLVKEIGPKDALRVMKWTKDHMVKRLDSILDSDSSCITDIESLFTFYQNEYDLPENLRIYKEETILEYGGVDKLLSDFESSNSQRKLFIINTLEKLEKDQDKNVSVELDEKANNSLKELNRKKK